MAKKLKKLNSFVKTQCANYVKDGCVYDCPCRVLEGKRCEYFEKAILGPEDYKYRTPGFDYPQIFEEYNYNIKGDFKKLKINTRTCTICGDAVLPRHKYCERCAQIQARNAQRERVRKHRLCNASTGKK